ncbi:hypothetical protein G6F24_012985 [Rhizopus arrhizus]|nr:hypothetical protein G6F24_012985 [Rhizopus arrhizus]
MPPSPVPGTKAACVLPPGVCHVGRRSPPPVPAHASGPPARGVTRCAVVEPAAVAAAAPAQRSQQAQGNPLGLWSGPGGDRRGLRLDRPRQRTGRTQPGQLPARQRPGRQPGHALAGHAEGTAGRPAGAARDTDGCRPAQGAAGADRSRGRVLPRRRGPVRPGRRDGPG